MALRGGQPGNRNAAVGKIWRDAHLQYARRGDSGITQGSTLLDKAVAAVWAKALSGDVPALKEIGNRLDGKPKVAGF